MTTYVENAILKLTDKTSRPARRITSLLKKMDTTAKRLKKSLAGIKLTGLGRGVSELNKLHTAIRRAETAAQRLNNARINLKVNTGNARRSIDALINRKSRLAKPVTMRVKTIYTPGGALTPPLAGRGAKPAASIFAPMRPILSDFARMVGFQVYGAIIRGFKEGASDTDVAQNRLIELGLNTKDKQIATDFAVKISKETKIYSSAEGKKLIGELIPTTRNDVSQAGELAFLVAKLAEDAVRRGTAPDKAKQDVDLLIRSGEMAGMITDAEGNIDLVKAEKFVDFHRKAAIQLGRQYDPALINKLVKALGNVKFSLDKKGMAKIIILAEERGTSAGTGTQQAYKNLSGASVKKEVRNNLASFGLLTTKQIKVGTTGGKARTNTVVDTVKDHNLLATDPAAWIAKHLVPVMERQGLDPDSPIDVAKFTSQVASRKEAKDFVGASILRRQELRRDADILLARNVSPEQRVKANAESLLLATAAAGAQLTSVLGEVTGAFETILIPSLNAIAAIAHEIAAFTTGPGDASKIEKLARGTAVVGGTVATGFGLAFGIKKIMDTFGLKSSAVALTGSAAELTLSAAALTRAAHIQSGNTVGGDTSSSKKVAGKGMSALKILGRIGMSLPLIGTGVVIIDEGLKAITRRNEKRAEHDRQLQKADAIARSGPNYFAGHQKHLNTLEGQIAKLNSQIETTQKGPLGNLVSQTLIRERDQLKNDLAGIQTELTQAGVSFTSAFEIVGQDAAAKIAATGDTIQTSGQNTAAGLDNAAAAAEAFAERVNGIQIRDGVQTSPTPTANTGPVNMVE